MRTCFVLTATSLLVGLTGCMIVESPIRGVVGTEVIWGDVAGKAATPNTAKHGKACAESILGLIAHGDASVRGEGERRDIGGQRHRSLGENLLRHRRRVVHAGERELGQAPPLESLAGREALG